MISFAGAIIGAAVFVWVGFRLGYRRGFADSEWQRDFDRCPHCGE